MEFWGLTGGIASGKSTVAAMFATLGIPILDADATYHRLLLPVGEHPSPLAQAIGAAFPGALQDDLGQPSARINRQWLGRLIFADAHAKAQLEQITHPVIAQHTEQARAALQALGCRFAIQDIPLLFERNAQQRFAGTILVWVPQALQHSRLAKRSGLSPQAIAQRIAQQMPLAEKRSLATYVIDNSDSLAHTQQQVYRLWQHFGCPLFQEQPSSLGSR